MGFNTVVVILNDHAHRLAEDPQISREMARAVTHGWLLRDRDRFATNFGAGSVVSQDHADGEQVVIVSRNSGCRADEADALGWQALDSMQRCLERHGYRVTKSRKRKLSPTDPDPSPSAGCEEGRG